MPFVHVRPCSFRQVVLVDHAEWLQRANKTQEALAAFLKSSLDFFNIYQVR